MQWFDFCFACWKPNGRTHSQKLHWMGDCWYLHKCHEHNADCKNGFTPLQKDCQSGLQLLGWQVKPGVLINFFNAFKLVDVLVETCLWYISRANGRNSGLSILMVNLFAPSTSLFSNSCITCLYGVCTVTVKMTCKWEQWATHQPTNQSFANSTQRTKLIWCEFCIWDRHKGCSVWHPTQQNWPMKSYLEPCWACSLGPTIKRPEARSMVDRAHNRRKTALNQSHICSAGG